MVLTPNIVLHKIYKLCFCTAATKFGAWQRREYWIGQCVRCTLYCAWCGWVGKSFESFIVLFWPATMAATRSTGARIELWLCYANFPFHNSIVCACAARKNFAPCSAFSFNNNCTFNNVFAQSLSERKFISNFPAAHQNRMFIFYQPLELVEPTIIVGCECGKCIINAFVCINLVCVCFMVGPLVWLGAHRTGCRAEWAPRFGRKLRLATIWLRTTFDVVFRSPITFLQLQTFAAMYEASKTNGLAKRWMRFESRKTHTSYYTFYWI